MAQAVSWSHYGINTFDCRQPGARDLPFLQNVQPGSGAHAASYSTDTSPLFHGVNGRGVNLTTPFHLAPISECAQLDLHSHIRLHGCT
jgi:hypothetical protein